MPKLVKLTSKNQLTLPTDIVRDYPGITYFEVRETNAGILLEPVKTVKVRESDAVLSEARSRFKKLGLNEKDIEDAVKWARENPAS